MPPMQQSAPNSALQKVRDSYIRANGEDPNNITEERRQELEEKRLKEEKEKQDQQGDGSADSSPERSLWESVKNGIGDFVSGQSLDSSISESTKRLQQKNQAAGRKGIRSSGPSNSK